MRLPKPFYKLPVTFDTERLRAELATFPAEAWAKHPNDIAGNFSLRLISVGGGENDEVNGAMLPTRHLESSPYLRQVLSSFGVVWSRSRLLRLSAQHGVPQHADINYHWFYRARLHIPIVTHPQVRFHCGDDSVHMAAGEAWIFDNWRLHRVDNPVEAARVHLVADTAGSAAFWNLVAQGDTPGAAMHVHQFDPAREPNLLTERISLPAIMPPGEVDLLILDLRAELTAAGESTQNSRRLLEFHQMLDAFRRDWRQLYSLFGDAPTGWPEFTKLRDSVRAAAPSLGAGLFMKTNRVAAHTVLEGRVLRAVISKPEAGAAAPGAATRRHSRPPVLKRPVFVIAAPRSGSTLLFETLAASTGICTLGGEAHWLVEATESLRLGAASVESNRLTAAHFSLEVGEQIVAKILDRLVDCNGRPVTPDRHLRFVEKTPKNSLRIPFFEQIFPDARFIYLWRDPRENISSIMEAWRSGNWKTYNGLDGFDGPWSLLLPPGWQQMNQRDLQEIAAFQWETTNRIIMDDLAQVPRDRWSVLDYQSLLQDPKAVMEKLCRFIEVDFDAALSARVSMPLPNSRFTQTAPAPDKWKNNQAEIERVMPGVELTWKRLRAIR